MISADVKATIKQQQIKELVGMYFIYFYKMYVQTLQYN